MPRPVDRLDLYRRMLFIRRFEEYIERLYMTDIMKTPVHLSIGQEASAVGVCSLLEPDEVVWTNYRAHAHYIAKGGDVQRLVNELHNRATGCSGGRGGSMHIIDTDHGILGTSAIVGANVTLAVGTAMADKMDGRPGATVVFFGDGASEEGGTYESLNFAAVKSLPLLFVCENNAYAVYSEISERATVPSVAERFKGMALPSFDADGNDLDAVRAAAQKALAVVRSGRPALLEVTTMLMREHVGTKKEAKMRLLGPSWERWQAHCPIKLYGRQLISLGLATPEGLAEMDTLTEDRLSEIFRTAAQEPLPDPDTLLDHVYA